jgi:hypothetical protein
LYPSWLLMQLSVCWFSQHSFHPCRRRGHFAGSQNWSVKNENVQLNATATIIVFRHKLWRSGTDTQNAWTTHYTAQNYYTRIIMIVLFSQTLCWTIFRKPIVNCLERWKQWHQLKKHSATQVEQPKTTHGFALVLKQMLQETTPAVQLPSTVPPPLHDRSLSIQQQSHYDLSTISALSDTIQKCKHFLSSVWYDMDYHHRHNYCVHKRTIFNSHSHNFFFFL